jgi:hypothetical protein
MTTFAFPSVTAHLPAESIRGRSSREILALVRAGLTAVLAAPAAENDGAALRNSPRAIPSGGSH